MKTKEDKFRKKLKHPKLQEHYDAMLKMFLSEIKNKNNFKDQLSRKLNGAYRVGSLLIK